MTPKYTFVLPPSAEAYRTQWTAALAKCRAILDAIEGKDGEKISPDNILETLNDYWVIGSAGENDAGLFIQAHPDSGIRDEAEKAKKEWSKLRTDLNMSRAAYEAIKACSDSGKYTDRESVYWMDKMLKEYRREGVDKDDETRAKVKAVKEEVDALKIQFDKNLSQDSRHVLFSPEQLSGLPDDFIKAHPAEHDGKCKITTDYPDYFPFMQYSTDSKAKQALYMAYQSRGFPVNGPVLVQLVNKRHELATLLGFANHADHKLEPEMVQNGDNVQSFIDKISSLAQDRMIKDLGEMAEVGDFPDTKSIPAWESLYLANKVKTTKYAFDPSAARQYFPFGRVRDGLMQSMEKLFDVTFKLCPDVPVYHPDVKVYELMDNKTGTLVGRFYLDLHPRENKYKHAAEYDMRSGSRDVLPESTLLCNFPSGDDSLMEHMEVTTFFHEFGHLLHHLFASGQKWVSLCGITCDWDFVEAPSQMLEEWAFDPDTLRSFAKNAKGEVIPDDMIKALRNSRSAAKGTGVRRQMSLAALSLYIYRLDRTTLSSPEEIDQAWTKLGAQYGPFPVVPDTHFPLNFGHLAGYSTAYYCYMWSQVIAFDLFSKFKANGLYDPKTAAAYRNKVLTVGGAKDAKDFVKDFLGREYNFDAMQEYLDE